MLLPKVMNDIDSHGKGIMDFQRALATPVRAKMGVS